MRESYNFRQGVVKLSLNPYEILQKYFSIYGRPAKPPRNVSLKKWLCHKPLKTSQISLDFALWKVIVSQTRKSVFALHFEKWIFHRPAKHPRNISLNKWLCHRPARHPRKFLALHFEKWMCHRPANPHEPPRKIREMTREKQI